MSNLKYLNGPSSRDIDIKNQFGRININPLKNAIWYVYTTNSVFNGDNSVNEDFNDNQSFQGFLTLIKTTGDTVILLNLEKAKSLYPAGQIEVVDTGGSTSPTMTTDDSTALLSSGDQKTFQATQDIGTVGGKDTLFFFSPVELKEWECVGPDSRKVGFVEILLEEVVDYNYSIYVGNNEIMSLDTIKNLIVIFDSNEITFKRFMDFEAFGLEKMISLTQISEEEVLILSVSFEEEYFLTTLKLKEGILEKIKSSFITDKIDDSTLKFFQGDISEIIISNESIYGYIKRLDKTHHLFHIKKDFENKGSIIFDNLREINTIGISGNKLIVNYKFDNELHTLVKPDNCILEGYDQAFSPVIKQTNQKNILSDFVNLEDFIKRVESIRIREITSNITIGAYSNNDIVEDLIIETDFFKDSSIFKETNMLNKKKNVDESVFMTKKMVLNCRSCRGQSGSPTWRTYDTTIEETTNEVFNKQGNSNFNSTILVKMEESQEGLSLDFNLQLSPSLPKSGNSVSRNHTCSPSACPASSSTNFTHFFGVSEIILNYRKEYNKEENFILFELLGDDEILTELDVKLKLKENDNLSINFNKSLSTKDSVIFIGDSGYVVKINNIDINNYEAKKIEFDINTSINFKNIIEEYDFENGNYSGEFILNGNTFEKNIYENRENNGKIVFMKISDVGLIAKNVVASVENNFIVSKYKNMVYNENQFIVSNLNLNPLSSNKRGAFIMRPKDLSFDDRNIAPPCLNRGKILGQPIFMAMTKKEAKNMDGSTAYFEYNAQRVDVPKFKNETDKYIKLLFLLNAARQAVNVKQLLITFETYTELNHLRLLAPGSRVLNYSLPLTEENSVWRPKLSYPKVIDTQIFWEEPMVSQKRYWTKLKEAYVKKGFRIMNKDDLVREGLYGKTIPDADYYFWKNNNIFFGFTDEFKSAPFLMTAGSTDLLKGSYDPSLGYGLNIADLEFNEDYFGVKKLDRRFNFSFALKLQDFFIMKYPVIGNADFLISDYVNNNKIDFDYRTMLNEGCLKGSLFWNGTNFDQKFNTNNGGTLGTIQKDDYIVDWDNNDKNSKSYLTIAPLDVDTLTSILEGIPGAVNNFQNKNIKVISAPIFYDNITIPSTNGVFSRVPQEAFSDKEFCIKYGFPTNNKLLIDLNNIGSLSRITMFLKGGNNVIIYQLDQFGNTAVDDNGVFVPSIIVKTPNIDRRPNDTVLDIIISLN